MKTSQIVCAGGANLDIQGFSNEKINLYDSNPGRVLFSAGGVGRNIAENLARLGNSVQLVSVVGSDLFGRFILEKCEKAGIDVSNVEMSSEDGSSIYLSLIDQDGDMKAAVSDMHIIKKLDSAFIQRHRKAFEAASVIVAEPNLSPDALDYLTTAYGDKAIFCDPISTTYARVLTPFVGRLYLLKMNRYEAEMISGTPIETEKDLERAADKLLATGLNGAVITLGKEGSFYKDHAGRKLRLRSCPLRMANATGAGDAFTAGMVHCYLRGLGPEDALRFSMGAACVALASQQTINPEMSVSTIQQFLQQKNMIERDDDFEGERYAKI